MNMDVRVSKEQRAKDEINRINRNNNEVLNNRQEKCSFYVSVLRLGI
jgi:hypothetical protein